MEAQSRQRVSKRSSYACSRCRRHKIKCSGHHPCERCTQRRQACIFDDRDYKVMVTRGHLADLMEKIAQLENNQATDGTDKNLGHLNRRVGVEMAIDDQMPIEEGPDFEHFQPIERSPDQDDGQSLSGDTLDAGDPEVTNPLTATPSRYLSASDGKAFYLGTSSNWSFSRRVLTATHNHIRQSPLPTESLLFDGYAYRLELDQLGSPAFDTRSIPSIDHAIYLFNAVKFHCCQLFHLFEEDEFMANLHSFYAKFEHRQLDESGLWYIQFLLVLAFGKSLVQRKTDAKRPPGAHFFLRAVRLLPDPVTLGRESVLSSEILCGMAWYYQALDFRHASHNLIGQAKSVAMNYGMHTDMSVADLGEKLVSRCRKIWWTVYVMDSQMTSLMGLPQSLSYEAISTQLPTYLGSTQRTGACAMHIKLTQILSDISTTIYGAKGQLNRDFVTSTRAVLESIASVADELSSKFPLYTDDKFHGISRLVAQLHLLYYQCMILATRPLLLCCLIKIFETPFEADARIASPKVRKLMQMCVESAQQIVNILDCLRIQDLLGKLETFLPLDLDPLFSATVVLLLARAVDARFVDTEPQWFAKSATIVDEMVSSGNQIAVFRKAEIQKMKELIDEFIALRHPAPRGTDATQHEPNTRWTRSSTQAASDVVASTMEETLHPNTMSLYSGVDSDGQVDELTAQQILDVASSMDWGDIEWSLTAGDG